MSEWDIIIDFKYNMVSEEPFDLNTNAKPEAINEVLSEYLRSHIGTGKDKSIPNKKDVYHILIGLDLNDDSFGTYSDTGNKSLTDGIVLKSISKLEELAKNKANLSAQNT